MGIRRNRVMRTVTLSHIHSGYTHSEQPVQAPNRVYWCYLAMPKRPMNADAMFEFHPHACNKGLLTTVLLWSHGVMLYWQVKALNRAPKWGTLCH